jgi:hypothetical protein
MVLTAAERRRSTGTAYDIADPEPLSFAKVVRISAHARSSWTWFVPVPLNFPAAAARGYELLTARARIRPEQPQRLTKDKTLNIEDATRDLGDALRPFAESPRMGLVQELST